jgi:hypothetical protein
MTASSTALLLQVIFPWLPEKLKAKLDSKTGTCCKVACETVALATIVAYNAFFVTTCMTYGLAEVTDVDALAVMGLSFFVTSFLLMSVSGLLHVACILVLFLFFLMAVRLKTNTGPVLLKVFSATMIVFLVSLLSVLSFTAIVVCVIEKYPYMIVIANALASCIFITVLIVPMNPRILWCLCSCFFRQYAQSGMDVRTPLIHHSEGEPTWEQRNTSSVTNAQIPQEMTDSYEQLP